MSEFKIQMMHSQTDSPYVDRDGINDKLWVGKMKLACTKLLGLSAVVTTLLVSFYWLSLIRLDISLVTKGGGHSMN